MKMQKRIVMMMAMILLCVSGFAQDKGKVLYMKNGQVTYLGVNARLGMKLSDLVEAFKEKGIEAPLEATPYSMYGIEMEKPKMSFVDMDSATYEIDTVDERDTIDLISMFLYSDPDYIYGVDMDGVFIHADMSKDDVLSLLESKKSQGVQYQEIKRLDFVYFKVNKSPYYIVYLEDDGSIWGVASRLEAHDVMELRF